MSKASALETFMAKTGKTIKKTAKSAANSEAGKAVSDAVKGEVGKNVAKVAGGGAVGAAAAYGAGKALKDGDCDDKMKMKNGKCRPWEKK